MTQIPRFYLLFILTLCLAGCSSTQTANDDGGPVKQTIYSCAYLNTTLNIDGKLDEAAWRRASVVDQFYLVRPGKGPAPKRTTARLLWDSQNLYVAFKALDEDVWSFSTKRDDRLWRGDVVEMFIKPSRTANPYYEFVISPNGNLYDAHHRSRGGGIPSRFSGWNATVEIATAVDGTADHWEDRDKSWNVELRIPWSTFNPTGGGPAAGDTWTFLVSRYDYSVTLEREVLTMSAPPNESGYPGFHGYEAYQSIRFEPK